MGERPGRASELGASAVEYAILVGLIAVVIMVAVATLGQSLFTDEVEVLGDVLEGSDAGDHVEENGGGPPCEALPDPADPPIC